MVDEEVFQRVESALARIDEWPVGSAAAAALGVDASTGGVIPLATLGATDEVFELASVTKLLTAAGALMAVEEGAIDLDEPAGPDGATVRHLLAHTSGVDFSDHKVRAKPGDKRIYSSAGYEILAEHIEKATGISFADYFSSGVCDALGLSATQLYGSAGHGARSTVGDLMTFAAEMLQPQVLDASTWAQARTIQWPEVRGIVPGYGMFKPCPWGLGPEIKGQKHPHWTGLRNSAETYGHFGQAGTLLWVDPQLAGRGLSAVALIALTDRDFGEWAKPLWTELGDAVVDAVAG